MQTRPPLALTAAVLAVHALLAAAALSLAGQPMPGRGPRHDGTGIARLSLVRADEVHPPAAAAPPPAGQPAAPPNPAPGASRPAAPIASAPPAATRTGAFVPQGDLDAPVRPRSAPDFESLSGYAWSGRPIRLRLFIDATGSVVDVQVLASQEPDELMDKMRAMFLATGFTIGTQGGRPVPCFKDVELDFSDRG